MRKEFICINLAVLSCIACNYVSAAGIGDIANRQDRYQESRRQDAEIRQRMDIRRVDLQADVANPAKIKLPEEEISFFIKKIKVECPETNRFNHLIDIVKKFEHKRMGVKGINVVTKALSDRLIEEGYITTTVVVPRQNLESGILLLKILPGRIGKIAFTEPEKMGAWRNAFPTSEGDILNIRRLEQGLEQMKRVPNQDVDLQLLPGERQGLTNVAINVKRTKPWSIGISIDDSGFESTGRLQAGISASLYNPTGLNDILSYSYGKDAESNDRSYGTDNYNLYYSIPYGNYTFNFSKYRNKYHQTVADLVPFRYDGETDGIEVGFDRLLYRDKTRKTQATFKVICKERHTYIDGEELFVQRQKTTAYRAGIWHRQYWGPTTMDMEVYYQKGMPWFNAEPGYTDGIAGASTTRYGLWGADFNLYTPVKLGKTQGNYRFRFSGQYTDDKLYGIDHFSIGGRYTVRGFSGELSLSAENGFFIQNELSVPLTKINMSPYIGIDYGHVSGPSADMLIGKDLAGAVLGVRGSIGSNIYYDGFLGIPVYKPQGFKADNMIMGFSTYFSF